MRDREGCMRLVSRVSKRRAPFSIGHQGLAERPAEEIGAAERKTGREDDSKDGLVAADDRDRAGALPKAREVAARPIVRIDEPKMLFTSSREAIERGKLLGADPMGRKIRFDPRAEETLSVDVDRALAGVARRAAALEEGVSK